MTVPMWCIGQYHLGIRRDGLDDFKPVVTTGVLSQGQLWLRNSLSSRWGLRGFKESILARLCRLIVVKVECRSPRDSRLGIDRYQVFKQ
jgi:hypothetical protein